MSMLNPWAIVGGLFLLIAVAFGGAQAGRKLERTHWLEEKAAMQKAQQAELLAEFGKRQREQLFHQATARKATLEHEKAITDLKQKHDAAFAANRASGGLRVNRSICNQAPGAEQAAGVSRPNEANAATVQLPDGVSRDLFALVKRADEIVEQCRSLQAWAISSGFYGDPPKPNSQ